MPKLSRREKYLRKTYGITGKQYKAMCRRPSILTGKPGGCNICGRKPKPGKKLHVDHDHKTKVVRGVLCYPCNHRLLGRGLEKPDLHKAAATYLESGFDARDI